MAHVLSRIPARGWFVVVAFALTRTTEVVLELRIARVAAMPSISGICMSIRITSKRSAAAAATARRPLSTQRMR